MTETAPQSLISPPPTPRLESALRDRVDRRAAICGALGELEPLAVRLGLIQNSLTPRFRDPVLAMFAADHGLAVEGVQPDRLGPAAPTKEQVHMALHAQLPVAVFARLQGLHLTVVDCGVADNLAPHARLMARKIAHGTRNAKSALAMSLEQAHAGVRVGMEIADNLPATPWPAQAWAWAPPRARRWCCRGCPTNRCASSSFQARRCDRTNSSTCLTCCTPP